MKRLLYEKMESMFHLIDHDYEETGALEMLLYKLARGNTFQMRVVGMDAMKEFRAENPDCAITFKPNHLSEADFILLSLLFRENGLRLLIEGGANLFIDHIDIFRDLLPKFVDRGLKDQLGNHRLSVAQYLQKRGAFKVFRNPVTISQDQGHELKLGRKEILSLTRAYRYHLVKQKEMYATFPGYSSVKSGILDILKKDEVKTGRSYTGKIDGFHHLPFQMDMEASIESGVDLYMAEVNIAYEQVMEDENFSRLIRMREAGVNPEEIYLQDMGYIIDQFINDTKKGQLSIKIAEPKKIDVVNLRESFLDRKMKSAAQRVAAEAYDRMLAMQPVFPANIFFSAFDPLFNRLPVRVMKEKIDDLRDRLRQLRWGREKRLVDLHYVTGYNDQLITAEEIINRTFDIFNTSERRTAALDGDTFVVYNKDVAQQYRNHVIHFFEPKK
jgi:hypothetical protein